MKLTRNILLQISVLTVMASFSSAAEEKIIFEDSFSDVKGHVISETDGKIERSGTATRRVLPFMGTSPTAIGKLTISALEDLATKGFDEKPGVLAISFQNIPSQATYCGFVYLGGVSPDRHLTLKEITDAPNLATLKRIKLKFQFKATNPLNPAAVGASYSCRLEPLLDSAYASRIDFGSIKATDKWQTFEISLDRGQNIENFLKSVSTAAPGNYKIVWAQDGPITNYQIGDTLSIDDIEFSQVLPPTSGQRNTAKKPKQ